MNDYVKLADEIVGKSVIAGAIFQELNQKETDRIVAAVFRAGLKNRVKLAKMAAEETRMGIWQHKVLKNVVATQLVYESIRNQKTVGIISEDNLSGITEIAQPLGPIFAIIPVTNPTSTILYKTLICLKSRNPVIFSPHTKAMNCGKEAVTICYEAALEAGAPDDCLQIVPEHSRELTHALMTHPKVALILATGGTGLVKAAYSSGNPAIGVGPGNVPVFIDASADIEFAVSNIISSKTFDNSTICASEQSIVVEKKISSRVIAELKRQECYILDADEVGLLEKVVIDPEKKGMNAEIVGKPVKFISDLAGFKVPEDTRLLIVPMENVGREYPLSGEILAPVLTYYAPDNYREAIKTCIELNYLGGIGHTASIYANDEKRIAEFSKLMNAGRIVVNTPSSQGAVGGTFNTLSPALTLGCGTGGKNITTENISSQHLINIQRVARLRPNTAWNNFDLNNFMDEKQTDEQLMSDYYKNL